MNNRTARASRVIALFVASAIAIALTTAAGTGAANAQVGQYYEIRNFQYRNGTGKCIDVPGSSTAYYQRLQIWDCHGGDNQLWARVYVGDGTSNYEIINRHSGMCIAPENNSSADLTPLVQTYCNGGLVTKWYDTAQFAENEISASITNAYTGTCIDLNGGVPSNGTPVQGYHCKNFSTPSSPALVYPQLWVFR
jgi:hypothetical protein